MSKLLKNTAYYTIGNFTSKAVNFLLLPLYTSYLTPDEYGIVNSMDVFSNILLIFFTLGLERAIYRLYYDYKTEKGQKDFLGTVSISIAVISLLVVGILFLFNSPIGKIYKSIDFHPYYTYAILTALFMTYELVPKISFQVKEQANKFLVLSLVILAFRVLSVIWQVVYLKAGAAGMLKGAMIGNAATLIFIIPLTLKQINLRCDFQILKSTLKYCLPFIPMIVSSWVINMSDRIFIERYFSTYDVGIYSLGYKIGQLVQFLSVSILMAYNPYFYKLANSTDQVTAKKKLYKVNNASIAFLMFIGYLVALFSKDIIILFFNEKYHETYKIIPIIVLGYFFIQLISLQNLSFYQEKKTITIMRINIAAAIINISLNFLLISKYSFYGAAISTALTQFLFFIIIYYYSRRYYFIPYNWKLIVPLFTFFILTTLLAINLLPVCFDILFLKICIILFILSVLIIKNKKLLLNTLFKK
ncbi:MAG TPA: hypothetical protein DER56_04455 [Thermosipho africanus]|nr:hypothetical protein [Thermosipho africanus]